jgi:uncharacterized protein YjbJ (UPF0337 family)
MSSSRRNRSRAGDKGGDAAVEPARWSSRRDGEEICPFTNGAHAMTDTPHKHPTADGIGESIKGKATEAKGKIEDAVGGLTGSVKTQAKGKLDEAKGKAEDALGKAERSADKHT